MSLIEQQPCACCVAHWCQSQPGASRAAPDRFAVGAWRCREDRATCQVWQEGRGAAGRREASHGHSFRAFGANVACRNAATAGAWILGLCWHLRPFLAMGPLNESGGARRLPPESCSWPIWSCAFGGRTGASGGAVARINARARCGAQLRRDRSALCACRGFAIIAPRARCCPGCRLCGLNEIKAWGWRGRFLRRMRRFVGNSSPLAEAYVAEHEARAPDAIDMRKNPGAQALITRALAEEYGVPFDRAMGRIATSEILRLRPSCRSSGVRNLARGFFIIDRQRRRSEARAATASLSL